MSIFTKTKTSFRLCVRVVVLTFCVLFFGGTETQAQLIVLDSVVVKGHRKTKRKVILREMDFRRGDTIDLEILTLRFETNKLYLMNTGLFSDVNFNLKDWNTDTNHAYVEVNIEETFFILPLPIFELADRNFSVWWNEMNHSLSRVNFGLRMYHINLTGRGDRIRFTGQWGYTRKFEMDYELPGLNRKKTIGVGLNILATKNKEIPYATIGNELVFENSEDVYLYKRQRVEGRLFIRPGLFSRQVVQLTYQRNRIRSVVKDELNPDFFGDDRTKLRWFAVSYEYAVDKRDIKPYPLTGSYLSGRLSKTGLGIFGERNALDFTGRAAKWFKLNDKFSVEAIVQGRYAFIRSRQPYYDMRALGYEDDYVRGYEYYVIDGTDYVYQKSTLRYELFNNSINFGKLSPLKAFRKMPTRVYFNLNNDLGWAQDNFYGAGNPLNDTLLWGRGVGLDINVYYTVVVQMEYTFNRLNEHGFFLHVRVGVD